MARHGLPAELSAENKALVPYWQRELTEDSRLMAALERDVTKTVEVLTAIGEGRAVDYDRLRGTRNVDMMAPSYYTIAEDLQRYPDRATHSVVVIRDDKNRSASVIIPSGASLDVKNDTPDLSKNHLVIALKKEKYDDIHFYNASGALALIQPNDYFIGKRVEVCQLDGFTLTTTAQLDLSAEIERSHQVSLSHVELFNDMNSSKFLLIIPDGEKPITVYPDQRDVASMEESKNSPAYDAVRETIGRKYYDLVRKNPELNANLLMPVAKEQDCCKLSDVNISKDKYKPDTYLLSAVIDGKEVNTKEMSPLEGQYFWLVDDKEMYKLRLAAHLFGDKLGIGEGLGAAQFPDGEKASGEDCQQSDERTTGMKRS